MDSRFSFLLLAGSLIVTSLHGQGNYDPGCGNTGDNDCGCECTLGSNPVNVMRGGLLRHVKDLEVFGPAGFAFERIYNSRTRDYTQARWELGTTYTWQHNWQYEVRESSLKAHGFPALIVRYPEGREKYFFAVDTSGSVRVSDSNWGDRLYPTSTAGQFILRTPEGREYVFLKQGSSSNYQYLLTEVRTGTGWQWTLTYQQQSDGLRRLHRITNNYGRYLELTRSQVNGTNFWRIDSITSDDGRSVSYGYSTWTATSQHVLTSVTYPDQTAAAYTWCGDESLTTGTPVLASAIDPAYAGTGARTKYLYNYKATYGWSSIVHGTVLEEQNYDTGEASVTLPLGGGLYPKVVVGGGAEVMRKFEGNNLLESADEEGRTKTFTYQTVGGVVNAGFRLSEKDGSGALTQYARDAVGNITMEINALGGVRKTTYSTTNFVLTETDELGRVTTHTRNAANLITRSDYPGGSYETFTYTGTGLLKTRRLRNGATESFNYDTLGNLISELDAAGHTTTHTYHNTGLRASTTDPLGHTTTFLYDWRGRLLRTTHPDATYVENTYGIHDRLLSTRDELNAVTRYTYDSHNRRITQTDPLDRTTTWTFGLQGACCGNSGGHSPLSVTYPGGRKISYTYDRSGKLLTQTLAHGSALASTVSHTYNVVGNLASTTDPMGRTSHYTYDLLNRQTSVSTPFGQTIRTYDAVGNVLTITTPTGAVTTMTYNVEDQPITIQNALNQTTSRLYDAAGRLTQEISPAGRRLSYTYDGLDRIVTQIDGADTPAAATTTYLYDACGQLVGVKDPLNRLTTHSYNARHFRTSSTDPLNRRTTLTYDAVGRVTLTTFPDATTERRAYDVAGQVSSVTDPRGETTTYTYDGEGRLSSLKTPRGHVRSWSYDAVGRLSRRTHADGTFEQFSYQQDHQLTRHQLPSGATATYRYTLAGRIASRDWSDATLDVVYSHDSYGRMVAAVNATSSVSWTYDTLNRKTTETQLTGSGPARTVTYTYDADGHLARLIYPDGHPVDYAYTPRHQLSLVTADGPPPLAAYTYNLAGERTLLARENGLQSTSTFDVAGQITSLKHQIGTSSLESLTYTLDAMGRRTVTSRPSGHDDIYLYDAGGQVISNASIYRLANSDSTQKDSFAYDAMGNRTSSMRNLSSTAYKTNVLDQYTSLGGVATTHDANGNLLNTPIPGAAAVAFSWDSENRLLSATRSTTAVGSTVLPLPAALKNGARTVNGYDALHRRTVKEVHAPNGSGGWTLQQRILYTYEGWNLIEERRFDGSGMLKSQMRYTWGADLSGTVQGAGGVGGLLLAEELPVTGSGTATAHYPASDGNGNVTLMTSASGAVEGSWRYNAFGSLLASTTSTPYAQQQPWRFSSKYVDSEVETRGGLSYYGYRHYSPELGRWLSRDPIGERGGVNLYGMIGNDAVNKWDKLGLIGGPGIGGPQWPGMPGYNPTPPAGPHPDNNPNQLGESFPDPYPACLNDGWTRHCVNSCILQHQTGMDWLTQMLAQASGHDLPGNPDRDQADVDANQAGIDAANSNGAFSSCINLCHDRYDQEVEKRCCQHDIQWPKDSRQCPCSTVR